MAAYLRLTGECHAADGEAAKDAVPAHVPHQLKPAACEQAMFEGGQHHLDQGRESGTVTGRTHMERHERER